MKPYSIITIVFTGVFFACFVFAQVVDEKKIPVGMELKIVGQTKLVIPKDAKLVEKDGLIIIEGIDKYVARNIELMKQNLEHMQERQNLLEQEVENLRKVLEQTKKEVKK